MDRACGHSVAFLRSALLAGLLLIGTLLVGPLPSPALADDTAVGGIGGDVYPLESTDIRMEAETVEAVLYRKFAEYRVDFTFVNEGERQTVKLGFPFRITQSGSNGNASVAFRAWQDGKPLAVTLGRSVSQEDLMSSDPPLGYFLHEATFPRGVTVITVSYLAQPTVSAGNRFGEITPPEFAALNVGGWSAHYDYWLHTGAGWRGTIEKAVVCFRLADSFDGWALDIKAANHEAIGWGSPTTSPETYVKLDERTYQWVFDEFEPEETDDIVLAFTTPVVVSNPAFPPAYGALASAGGASERLGPNSENGMPPGWEAIDGSPETAWGITAPGAGGWIRAEIRGNQNLREVRILPGRNDTPGSFYEYGRPKTVSVALSDGTNTIITLKDEPALQKFAVSGAAEWVQFGVLDIYPGSKSNDTYVSEIDFGTKPAPAFELSSTPLAEQAPPTAQPSTTLPTTTSLSPVTTQSPAATSTTGGPATTIARTETGSSRLVWPAYIAIAVAVIALGALIFLVVKLQASRRRA